MKSAVSVAVPEAVETPYHDVSKVAGTRFTDSASTI